MRTPAPPESIAGLPFLSTRVPHVTVSTAWTPVGIGTDTAAVAERDALGTNVRVAVWPAHHLAASLGAVDEELDRLDRAASRFRDDSEISRVHHANGGSHLVSPGLAEAVGVALAAACWTGGLVDPTVGAAIIGLGYDRDFAAIRTGDGDRAAMRTDAGMRDQRTAAPVPGWRSVRLDGTRLSIPAGTRLDLGATAKGLGSDRAAAAAWHAAGGGGVLVSLGGDIAVAGDPPSGGWPVLVADSSRPGDGPRPWPDGAACQLIRLASGSVATSSVTGRQWRRDGRIVHHIIDPRTGCPAGGPWRTVSVAASRCAEANAAATAAIVAGAGAAAWLSAMGLPARLVSHGGTVRRIGGWPAAEGSLLPAVPLPLMGQATGAAPMDSERGTASMGSEPGSALPGPERVEDLDV